MHFSRIGWAEIFACESSRAGIAHMVARLEAGWICSCEKTGACKHIETVRKGTDVVEYPPLRVVKGDRDE